jgi:hypothetical protein
MKQNHLEVDRLARRSGFDAVSRQTLLNQLPLLGGEPGIFERRPDNLHDRIEVLVVKVLASPIVVDQRESRLGLLGLQGPYASEAEIRIRPLDHVTGDGLGVDVRFGPLDKLPIVRCDLFITDNLGLFRIAGPGRADEPCRLWGGVFVDFGGDFLKVRGDATLVQIDAADDPAMTKGWLLHSACPVDYSTLH